MPRASLSLAVIFVLVTVALGPPTRADDALDPASIRANVQAAEGSRPDNERLVERFTYAGTNGTRVTLRSNGDVRVTTTFGPFESASGRYRGQAWRQNQNGQTVRMEADSGRATGEAYRTVVEVVAGPPSAYVLSTLNAAGYGSRETVDPAAWRVVRRESISATGTSVTDYDDFRTTGGYTRPWHWTVRDAAHPANDGEYRIESDAFGSVDPADLAVPPTRRPLVTFPEGVRVAALPAHVTGDSFVVRGEVGRRGLDFELDTGASGIVIDDDVAKELGLPSYATFESAGNAGRFTARLVVIPELHVGPLVLHDVVASTIPHVGADRPGMRVVGLLGFDFIDALALKLDYGRGTVTAYESGADIPKRDPRTAAVHVRLGTQQPMAEVTVDGALGDRFMLDTGGHGSLLLFDYFARRHPEAFAPASDARERTFVGVGGLFHAQPVRLADVELGALSFHDVRAFRVTSSGSFSGDLDGLVGTDVFRAFTLYVDYADQTMEFEPADVGRDPR